MLADLDRGQVEPERVGLPARCASSPSARTAAPPSRSDVAEQRDVASERVGPLVGAAAALPGGGEPLGHQDELAAVRRVGERPRELGRAGRERARVARERSSQRAVEAGTSAALTDSVRAIRRAAVS